MGKKVYWGIIWGDNLRWGHKHEKSKTACEHAYGLATSDMEAVNLGARKPEALKKFQKLFKERNLKGN